MNTAPIGPYGVVSTLKPQAHKLALGSEEAGARSGLRLPRRPAGRVAKRRQHGAPRNSSRRQDAHSIRKPYLPRMVRQVRTVGGGLKINELMDKP